MQTKNINKGFYFCFKTLQKSSEPKPGFVFIASQLELKVYRKLEQLEVPFFYQFKLELLKETRSHSSHCWNCDFKILGSNTIVEAKGEWIMKPSFKAERAHFLLNHQLAESLGYKVLMVSDKSFQLTKNIRVLSLGELNHGYDF